MQGIVALLDLDYFYAQCEMLRNPSLKGKPVAIVIKTVRENSGVIATSNYEARKLKIRSGMPILLAKKLSNEETIFIEADKPYYKEISEKVFEIVSMFCEKIEQVSIDEAYLDLANEKGFDGAEEKAKKIKEFLKGELGLTCSIGISVNKFLSKMASDENKPNGLTIIKQNEIDSFISNKKSSELPGLGPKASKLLHEKGVETISDLKTLSEMELVQLFGSAKGKQYYNFSRGIDERELKENREKKQISRMITLKKDTLNSEEILPSIKFLSEIVFKEIKKMQKSFKTTSLIIITNKFETLTKSHTSQTIVSTLDELNSITENLLKEFLSEAITPVRRIGVRVSSFEENYGYQKKLFDFK
jgi:DNA polymerase IV (archaeal DinB-like DNA polymerase)